MAITISGDSPNLTSAAIASPVFSGTPTGTGVLTSGTAVASTSGTSIDFTSIPSWVKRVTVMFSEVSTNGSSPLQIRLGTSGGVVSTGYLQGGWYGTSGGQYGNGTTAFALGGTSFASSSSVWNGSYVFTLLGNNTWTGIGTFMDTGVTVYGLCSGSVPLGGTLDRVRCTTLNGTDTFDAGSINILYE
jgi:hypothetical protein